MRGDADRLDGGVEQVVWCGKEVRQLRVLVVDSGAELLREPSRERPRRRHRHLLSQHGSDRELEPINRAGNAKAWACGNERGEPLIHAEIAIDQDRVGVKIEQRATAAHSVVDLAVVAEPRPQRDGCCTHGRLQVHDRVTGAEAKRARIRVTVSVLDTGDSTGAKPRDGCAAVERTTMLQLHHDGRAMQRRAAAVTRRWDRS